MTDDARAKKIHIDPKSNYSGRVNFNYLKDLGCLLSFCGKAHLQAARLFSGVRQAVNCHLGFG